MKTNLKQTFLLCGIALMLAAFPVFGQSDVRLNRKPINDLADFVTEKIEKDKIDLTKPFAVELKSVLDKNGKLDAEKSVFVREEGDAQMVEIAKRAVLATNDSGFFQYLKQLDVENVIISLSQNEQEISAIIIPEFQTESRAKSANSVIGVLLQMIPTQRKLDADEKTILNAIKVKSDGKQLVLNATLPKAVWYEMINRKLIEQKVAEQIELQRVNE